MQLNKTHYHDHHTYRVEWEPPDLNGEGGYVKWFTDGLLVSGIFGDSLGIMETEIPSEPMYMLLNTAVSSSWGFPTPCPDGCECDCFQCGNPECACGLPPGYCENFPAAFEIDYVRVYQAVNESRHTMGCSPAHRPTAQFIQGHVKRYVEEGETMPLQPVRAGGGSCTKPKDCGQGARRGICSPSGTCSCNKGWTGPHCRSHAAFYDVDISAKKPEFSSTSVVFASFTSHALNRSSCTHSISHSFSSRSKYYGISTQPDSNDIATNHCVHIIIGRGGESEGPRDQVP